MNRGAKDTWYYNPNNPEQIGPYASFETVASGHKKMLRVYLALQVIAIFLLIWSIRVWKKAQGLSWNSGVALDWKPEGTTWSESAEWKSEGTAWSESAEWKSEGTAWSESAEWKSEGTAWSESVEWESKKQDLEAWGSEQEEQ